MTTVKAIVISEAPGEALSALMADLDLPRRALSLPVEPNAADGLPSFIELWGDREAVRELAVDWPFPSRAWLVAEYVPVVYDRTWPSGQASPGLRMVSTVHRRAGMSRSEFEKHWRGPHTEIAKSYTVPVWHYSQNVVVEALSPGCDEDGFVGMHFRTAADLRARWQDHPIEAARGAKDAALFMTVERAVSMTAVETVWDIRR
jgi:hypothetical protein